MPNMCRPFRKISGRAGLHCVYYKPTEARPSNKNEREDPMSQWITPLTVCVGLLVSFPLQAQQPKSEPNTHVLKPTPKTVVWGYYDAASKPVLKIKSGDTVEVQTIMAGSPARLKEAFLPDE